MFRVFHVLLSIDESKLLRLSSLAFLLHSLRKAPDNNTPAIIITPSSVSLEVVFVARFVAAVFWRGCG